MVSWGLFCIFVGNKEMVLFKMDTKRKRENNHEMTTDIYFFFLRSKH